MSCVEAHSEARRSGVHEPGGIRVSINFTGEGAVTYAALYAVQPLNNHLATMTLIGQQLLRLLEQQWSVSGLRRLLVSKVSGFAWNPDQPQGARIVRDSVVINGQAPQANRDYRVTVNSFLADGGDNLLILRERG
jgi:5'-nucleotidase